MFSIVIPAHNEAGNIVPLIGEIVRVLATTQFEIVVVDDGSTDTTVAETLSAGLPEVRVVRHATPGGQSAAIHSGVLAARFAIICTLDGDGQNDPADMPGLLRSARETESQSAHFCIAGYRKNRQDTEWKKFQSRIANAVRQKILNDQVPDTGCGLKLIPRATWLQLPYFDHMHRYLPALVLRLGGAIRVVPVNHRARQAGISKYNAWNRLWVGLVDMAGVVWLTRRGKRPVIAQVRTLAAHEESH